MVLGFPVLCVSDQIAAGVVLKTIFKNYLMSYPNHITHSLSGVYMLHAI